VGVNLMRVRFLIDDPYGLWKKGDHAEDLGLESDHPDAPNIRMLRLSDDQIITLEAPYERGTILKDDDRCSVNPDHGKAVIYGLCEHCYDEYLEEKHA
jgi:hypothetical protein